MKSTDIQLDNDRDLLIRNGDFEVGLSDDTHIEHIFISRKGHWRQHPLVGIAIEDYQLAAMGPTKINELKKKTKLQLQLDGYTVTRLNINPTEVDLKTTRNGT